MNTTQYKCPACGRDIPNRRSRTCGYCGVALPNHLRFSDEQIAKMKSDEINRKRNKIIWAPTDSGPE